MKHLLSLLALAVILSACGDGSGAAGGPAPAAETAATSNLPQGEFAISKNAYWTTLDSKFFAIVFDGQASVQVNYNFTLCQVDREFTHTGFNTYTMKLSGTAKYPLNWTGCSVVEGSFAVSFTGTGYEDISVSRQ